MVYKIDPRHVDLPEERKLKSDFEKGDIELQLRTQIDAINFKRKRVHLIELVVVICDVFFLVSVNNL